MKTIDLIASTSAASSRVSCAVDLGDMTTFSVHVTFSGADVAGTLTLEASDTPNDADFVTVPNSTQAVTASADHVWSVTGAGYRYVRVRWVYTSGTGDIAAYFVGKELRLVGG